MFQFANDIDLAPDDTLFCQGRLEPKGWLSAKGETDDKVFTLLLINPHIKPILLPVILIYNFDLDDEMIETIADEYTQGEQKC